MQPDWGNLDLEGKVKKLKEDISSFSTDHYAHPKMVEVITELYKEMEQLKKNPPAAVTDEKIAELEKMVDSLKENHPEIAESIRKKIERKKRTAQIFSYLKRNVRNLKVSIPVATVIVTGIFVGGWYLVRNINTLGRAKNESKYETKISEIKYLRITENDKRFRRLEEQVDLYSRTSEELKKKYEEQGREIENLKGIISEMGKNTEYDKSAFDDTLRNLLEQAKKEDSTNN